jgi:hypothetical protein
VRFKPAIGARIVVTQPGLQTTGQHGTVVTPREYDPRGSMHVDWRRHVAVRLDDGYTSAFPVSGVRPE